MAMASPNFAVVEPATNGFTAVNERLSPPSSASARPIDTTPPLQQKESWSHANGDTAAPTTENSKSQSPQSTLPAKRRFGDVDPASDDASNSRTGSASVSPELNGRRLHTNGNDTTDPRLSQSNPGARDPNWSSQMDDVRMAQLLQAESNTRPENGLSQSGSKDGPTASPDGQPTSSDLVTTKAGLQYDQKKRKRAFTNRTKTGCTTCRKRKKKCDEAKPHCNNCLRGGFPCGGYTQRRDITDASKNAALQAKYPPVPIQSREYWETPSTARSSRSYEPSPLHGLPEVRHNSIMEDGVGHGPVGSWSSPINGAPRPLGNDRSLPPPMQSSYAVPRGISGLNNIYSGTNSGYAPIPLARRAMAETEKHLGQPLTNNITESPQNNLEQMITGRYFKPNEPELVELRKRAETACERFNHVSSQGMGQEEMLRCLRNIVEYDPKKPDSSLTPSGAGIRVGTGVKVHSPFWVDYGFNIRFGDNVTIKGGCRIEDCREVQIGNGTVIGPGVTISGELHFHDPGYKIWRRGLTIRIGRNVFIGAGVVIAPTDYPPSARDAGEIVIGDEAYISPGTVVCSNVPQKAIIGAKSLWERLGDPHTPHHH